MPANVWPRPWLAAALLVANTRRIDRDTAGGSLSTIDVPHHKGGEGSGNLQGSALDLRATGREERISPLRCNEV